MSTQGLRLWIFFAGVLGLAGGCAALPPSPDTPSPDTASPGTANTYPPSASSPSVTQHDDEGGGWLFDRLTGRPLSAPQQNTSSGVVQASAAEPVASLPAFPATAPATAPNSDENDSGFDWSDLAPENVIKNIKAAAGYGPNEGVARALLKEGEALFEQKKYSEATDRFKSAAKRWPDSVLEEDALFWLAECCFFSDQYPKAQDTYDKLLKKYDNSRHLDTAVKRLFAIGRYWEQLHEANPHWPITPILTDKKRPTFDTFGNALKAYETVRMMDPIGPLADDSIMATANAYFRRGRYEDAAYHYDMLINEYPNSEHQKQAHELGLQSKLRVYQGPFYDGTPLEEADGIAEQALIQFPGQLGSEQTRVAQTRDRIVQQKAERDWEIAQYYEKKKDFGAARLYYQYIIKDYPLTQAAGRARVRLEQIRNQPDHPPNRFKWLTDLVEPKDDMEREPASAAPLQWIVDEYIRPFQHPREKEQWPRED